MNVDKCDCRHFKSDHSIEGCLHGLRHGIDKNRHPCKCLKAYDDKGQLIRNWDSESTFVVTLNTEERRK